MYISEFDFNLPKELIAQVPAKPRDHSRLLILDKATGRIEHKRFFDIADYLEKGDMLVMNNSKVFPARLIGRKETGGKIEVFLLRIDADERGLMQTNADKSLARWICLIGGKGAKEGMRISFDKKLETEIIKNNHDGTWIAQFNKPEKEMMKIVEKIGQVPLPPYIKRSICPPDKGGRGVMGDETKDKSRYQTIYADETKIGSVAAPTAGLHFTRRVLAKLKRKGVKIEYVTLHVGLGTFASVKTEEIENHKMHAEWAEASAKTINNIIKTKNAGKKIFAVGTTSARTLETIFSKYNRANNKYKIIYNKFSAWTDIFIYPGYEFKAVDAIITNFHLPKSTLLMLVSALAGRNNIIKAYNEAIREKYRFFSYGDAMLIK